MAPITRSSSGVPIGSSFASLTISQFGSRMQPCEGWPGISDGSFVPWIPITPPPGQSVSTLDSAEVPNAIGPYSLPAGKPSSRSRM